MTEYGESVTQKEILIDSYLVVPGFSEESGKYWESDSINTGWEIVAPKNHVLTFKEFHFSHHILKEPTLLRNKLSSASDFVMMQFCLSGDCSYNEKGKKAVSFKTAEHNILFVPKNADLTAFFKGNPLEVINVYFEKSFLLKYIPANHLLINKINSKSLASMSAKNLSVGPKIQSVLLDIINCGFEGHLKKLFTQAKIIELLTLQLAQLEEEKNNISGNLKQSDIDKMMVVKEIITSNFKESFSLPFLARSVGTNEQYLKKNFKILFGSTVFNYMLACKMEKAKELILQGEYRIAEVAELTGYKHATHFTSAFKKFFGYLPQKIKGKLELLVISVEYFDFLELVEIIQF